MKNNFKYITTVLLVVVIFISQSCIEKFTPMLNESDVQNLLVVEGRITDEVGPFKVRLTNSVSVYSDPNILNKDHPVYGAGVQIFDDKGNTFTLYETENGWYETENKNLKGTVGNTYSLLISTDNKQYESSPVLMQETPDIEKIHSEKIQRTQFNELEPYEENWINVLIDSKAPINGAYLRWEFEETWEFEMPSRVLVNHGMGESSPPASIEIIDIDPERMICWVTEPSRQIIIESTVGYENNRIKNFVLQTIGPNSDKLNIKYSVLVKQYSIGKELYNILKKLRESNIESEGIYSKIPGQAFGNITCCNTDEKVLGYFSASSVKSQRIFMDRFEHDINKGSAYELCGWTTAPPPFQESYFYGTYKGNDGNIRDVWSTNIYCTDCRKRGTNVKPDFWE